MLIDQLSDAQSNSLEVRAQIGVVTIVADVYADVTVNGDLVPLVPIRPGLSVAVDDVVLIWRVGESWILGEVLPTEPETIVPEGFIDTTPVGEVPPGWDSYGQDVGGTPSASVNGWTVYDEAGHSGDRMLGSEVLASINGSAVMTSDVFALVPGETYFAGVFTRASADFPGTVTFQLYGAADRGDVDLSNPLAIGLILESQTGVSTGWTLLSDAVTVPAGVFWGQIKVSRNENTAHVPGTVIYLDDFLTRLT